MDLDALAKYVIICVFVAKGVAIKKPTLGPSDRYVTPGTRPDLLESSFHH